MTAAGAAEWYRQNAATARSKLPDVHGSRWKSACSHMIWLTSARRSRAAASSAGDRSMAVIAAVGRLAASARVVPPRAQPRSAATAPRPGGGSCLAARPPMTRPASWPQVLARSRARLRMVSLSGVAYRASRISAGSVNEPALAVTACSRPGRAGHSACPAALPGRDGGRRGADRGDVAAGGPAAAQDDDVGMACVIGDEPTDPGGHLPPVAGDVADEVPGDPVVHARRGVLAAPVA